MCESRRYIVWALIPMLGLLSAACKEEPPQAAPHAEEAMAVEVAVETKKTTPQSPAEVAVLLGRYHSERDYARIAPLIAADRRDETMAFLQAVDRVLAASTRLRRAAESRFGSIPANAWNLSAMENNLGVFSAETQLINQRFRGNRAIVTMQEAENVPLVRAAFESSGGVWRLSPDPLTQSMLPELEELARVLSNLSDELEGGARFEAYVEAFFVRVLPQMARVVTAKDGAIRVTDASEASQP